MRESQGITRERAALEGAGPWWARAYRCEQKRKRERDPAGNWRHCRRLLLRQGRADELSSGIAILA